MAPQDYPILQGFAVVIALLWSVYETLVVATGEDILDAITHIKEAITFLLEALIPATVNNAAANRKNALNERKQSSCSTSSPTGTTGEAGGGVGDEEGSSSDSSSDEGTTSSSSSESTKSLLRQVHGKTVISKKGESSWLPAMGPDGRPVGGGNLKLFRQTVSHQAHVKNWLRQARKDPRHATSAHRFIQYVRAAIHSETPLPLEQLFGIPSTQPLPMWPTARTLKRIIRNNGAVRPKVLVLDLDETLLCAVVDKQSHSVNYHKPTYHEAIPTATGATLYAVWERPHVHIFLSVMRRLYTLVLFTASLSSYADPLVDHLERSYGQGGGGRGREGAPIPSGHVVFKQRLYREHCTRCTIPCGGGGGSETPRAEVPTTAAATSTAIVAGCEPPPVPGKSKRAYVKDLTRLGVPIQDTIILDNKAESFALQPENGLVIKNFDLSSLGKKGGPEAADTQLLALIPVLTALAFVPDVRHVLRMQLPTAHQ